MRWHWPMVVEQAPFTQKPTQFVSELQRLGAQLPALHVKLSPHAFGSLQEAATQR
jgi:hypothetical protein